MKKFKIAFFFLLIAAMGLILWSNWPFFSTKYPLEINLIYKGKVYVLPAIENGLYLVAFFLVGYLMASFRGLMTRFQNDRIIKTLNDTVTSQMEKLSSLKKEVEFLKRNNGRPTQTTNTLPDQEKTVVEG